MPTKIFLLDSNVLSIILFNKTIELKDVESKYREKIRKLYDNSVFFVPDFIVTEFFTLIQKVYPKRYSLNLEQIYGLIDIIKAFIDEERNKRVKIVTINKDKFVKDIKEYKFTKSGISLTDYLLIQLALEYNCDILSLDKKLNNSKGAYFSG